MAKLERPVSAFVSTQAGVALQAGMSEKLMNRLFLALVVAEGAFLRLWQLTTLGYNTDEAVYSGTAAAIMGDPTLSPFFPIFRAHPLLAQLLLSFLYRGGVNDWAGRVLSAAFGLATVYLTYKIGELLYNQRVGLIAALIVSLMPIHVIVSRQFLLDGPMTTMATLTLYLVAQYAKTGRPVWLYATSLGMGLTFHTKETGVVMVGAIYAFLALSPELRVRLRDVITALAFLVIGLIPFPLTLFLARSGNSGQNYLVWQLFRRPNHDPSFYFEVLPGGITPLVLVVALIGFLMLLRRRTWREKLLSLWILVPFAFFQLWPVKGYQYTLPIVVPIAIFAANALGDPALPKKVQTKRGNLDINWSLVRPVAIGVISIFMLFSSWTQIQASFSDQFTAGTGGVPGGREAGMWVKQNVPLNAKMMALGPSMANIIQFYGQRKVYGLSVSSNPLHRNPSYEPMTNPDLQFRTGEIQYIIWDSFSASRSAFFSDHLLNYVQKYHGRVVHTEAVNVKTSDNITTVKTIIIIYEVRP